MTTYVLECYWPDVTEVVHDAAVRRAEEAARTMRAEGRSIQFLGGALMPADEVAFYRFAAASPADVERAGDLAALPFERVIDYVERPADAGWREP